MANISVKNARGYTVESKPRKFGEPREEGKYLVTGGSKPYIVTLTPEWKGARCSCPAAIFQKAAARKPCKHERMAREAVGVVEQLAIQNPTLSVQF